MPTESEIVEWLDPDWRDHYADIESAAEDYRRYAPAEWAKARAELVAMDAAPDPVQLASATSTEE